MAMIESYEAVELKEFQIQLYNRTNENDVCLINHRCDVNVNLNGALQPCLADFTEKNSKPVLTIDEAEGTAFEKILDAIYSSLRLLPENVYFILKASHFLLLDVIKNAWIMKNTDIHCLIDVCLFAKSIEEEKLYRKCVGAISQDVLRLSRAVSFKDVPFDTLKHILSICDASKIDGTTSSMIIEWSRYNKANSTDVQELFESANLKSKMLSVPIKSELIVSSDNDLLTEKAETISKETELNSHFNVTEESNDEDCSEDEDMDEDMKDEKESFEGIKVESFGIVVDNVQRVDQFVEELLNTVSPEKRKYVLRCGSILANQLAEFHRLRYELYKEKSHNLDDPSTDARLKIVQDGAQVYWENAMKQIKKILLPETVKIENQDESSSF